MTNEEIAVELKAQGKDIEALKDDVRDLGEKQDALNDLAASVRAMAVEQTNQKSDLGEIKSDVKALMYKPAKRWDGLVDKVLLVLAGAFVAWIASGMPGIK